MSSAVAQNASGTTAKVIAGLSARSCGLGAAERGLGQPVRRGGARDLAAALAEDAALALSPAIASMCIEL